MKAALAMFEPVGLVSVIVSTELCPTVIVVGENALVMSGCPTDSVALATLPVSAIGPVAATWPVVFRRFPATELRTLNCNVQLAPAASVTPDKRKPVSGLENVLLPP